MLKVIKFIVLLPLKIAALPIIVALIAATWIAVFCQYVCMVFSICWYLCYLHTV